MAILAAILGWILLVSATFVWAGHGIYQLVKTDLSFWSVLFTNGGFWLLQLVTGLLLVFVGVTAKTK